MNSTADSVETTTTAPAAPDTRLGRILGVSLTIAGCVIIAGVLIWQAITAGGNPDPMAEGIGAAAVLMNTGIVVFREGLEAVLVLAALTASLVRKREDSWKPIVIGSAISFAATIVTWFVVVAVVDSIEAPVLQVQAATGLLAIIVLLVILNWFFHKIYWTGWIALHEKRKRAILESAPDSRGAFWGLVVLGLTAMYREGFEVVLFLQTLRLQSGNAPVLAGATIGVALTGIVAALTFVAQRKLPFKQLLVATGVMIAVVLVVMVGATGQAMQLAGWLPTTPIPIEIPEWIGAWFGIYPNVEGLAAQAIAATLVLGSYWISAPRSTVPSR